MHAYQWHVIVMKPMILKIVIVECDTPIRALHRWSSRDARISLTSLISRRARIARKPESFSAAEAVPSPRSKSGMTSNADGRIEMTSRGNQP